MNELQDKKELEGILNSDRYTLLKFLGSGTWGKVFSAKDKRTGVDVAIKVAAPTQLAQEQMLHRKTDIQKMMSNEASKPAACSNVVPRYLDFDSDGTPFLVMPKYNQFLPEYMEKNRRDDHGAMKLEDVVKISKSVAHGLAEIHRTLGRVHGDLKADNIAVKNGEGIISDLGTSTVSAYGRSISPRDNIGDISIRAPECFDENSHPTERSDVWSFGSLAYKMFSGKYVFEDEFNSGRRDEFVKGLTEKEAKKLINKKLKNVPRQFRKVLGRCLKFDPSERYYDGGELEEEFKDAVENLDFTTAIKKTVSKYTLPVAAAASIMALAAFASTQKTKEIRTPPTYYSGTVYDGKKLEGGELHFDRENLDLPSASYKDIPLFTLGTIDTGKEFNDATDDRYASFLLKRYYCGIHASRKVMVETDAMKKRVLKKYGKVEFEKQEYGLPPGIVAKSIEMAMKDAPLKNGKIDLEDVCTITREGVDAWNAAKNAAHSQNYKEYISAKDSDGKSIIPKEEQEFLNSWLAFIR